MVAAKPLQETLATPESASVTVPVTCNRALLTNALLSGVVIEITGGVLSILTMAVVLALFPALSTAVPVTVWLAPSLVNDTGALHEATPDSASAQLKLTVTEVLFQFAVFGGGATCGTTVGAVLSKLAVTDMEAELPTRSIAVPLTI